MQKKFLAVAVAGLLSHPAFAQSNVTIYGVADAFLASYNGSGKRVTGVDSGGLNSSRLGFKGSEDLGNGLKAVFLYEFGTLKIDQGSNNGINSTRQSYVGLSGGFGTVVGGRLQTPGYNAAVKYDAATAMIISPVRVLTGQARGKTLSITSQGGQARQNNAVAYVSPKFSGVTGTVAYAFGEQDGAPADEKRQGVAALGLDYDGGPLAVNYTYQQIDNFGGDGALDINEHFVGASYDLGVLRVVGSWQTRRDDQADTSDRFWNLGAVVPVGPSGKVHVAYAKARLDRADDAKAWSLAYTHTLSKRTALYGGYTRLGNDGNQTFGLLNGITSSDPGRSVSALALGMRHTF